MKNRIIANFIKATFKYIIAYVLLMLLIFSAYTIYKDEVKLLFKQQEITSSIDNKYYGSSYFSGDSESLRNSIQNKIINDNLITDGDDPGAIPLAFYLIVIFLIINGVIKLVKFTKKHAD